MEENSTAEGREMDFFQDLPLDMLGEISVQLDIDKDSPSFLCLALSCRYLYNYFQYRIPEMESVSEIACSNGYTQIIAMLLFDLKVSPSLHFSPRCVENAILFGHIETVEVLFTLAPDFCLSPKFIPNHEMIHDADSVPWFAAGATPKLNIVELLRQKEEKKEYPSFSLRAFLYGAAFGGQITRLSEYSMTIRKMDNLFLPKLKEFACLGGQVDVLNWLLNNNLHISYCLKDLNLAIRSGNRTLIGIIIVNGVPATKETVQHAGACGSIEGLNFLQTRLEMNYVDLLNYAVISEKVETVEWILRYDSKLFRSTHLFNKHYACAALKGNVRLFKLLYFTDFSASKRKHFEKFGNRYFENGIQSGKVDILRYFKFIHCGWERAESFRAKYLNLADSLGLTVMKRFLLNEVFSFQS